MRNDGRSVDPHPNLASAPDEKNMGTDSPGSRIQGEQGGSRDEGDGVLVTGNRFDSQVIAGKLAYRR